MDRLLELIGSQCKFCSLQSKVSVGAVGCSLVVKMVCSRGHTFSCAPSPVVTNSNKSVLYKGNLIFAISFVTKWQQLLQSVAALPFYEFEMYFTEYILCIPETSPYSSNSEVLQQRNGQSFSLLNILPTTVLFRSV